MPDINIGQQGKLKSMPKITKINGDDALALVYRNMGNNHAYPFIWSETVTVASGSTGATVISGVKFHGMAAASYCNFCATPTNATAAGLTGVYIDKNTSTNVVSLVCSTAGDSATFDVFAMVGVDPDVSTIASRGNKGAAQSLP